MDKKRLVISYEKLSGDLRKAFNAEYPDGFDNNVIKVDKGNGDFFYAVTLETEDTTYLVKVDVKIDTTSDEETDERDDDYENDIVQNAVPPVDNDFNIEDLEEIEE